MSRLRRTADDGFTLVEVLVALTIFAAAAAALVPLMLVSLKAATTARMETQAKNLAQQQIERMRNLAFHVAHENGDYVDLLDLYYTDRNAAAATLTSSTPRSVTPYQDADGSVVVQYLSDAGGTAGRPSGAAYQVRDLQFADYPEFSVEILTQFLTTTRTVAVPVSTYDSQTASQDSPATQLLGVTVLVTWVDGSGPETFRTYTEMADARGLDALLSTQARSTALRVTGTDLTGNSLLAQAAVVQADGSVSSGSAATVAAEAARLEQIGVQTEIGQSATVSAPPSPAGATGTSSVMSPKLVTGSSIQSCGWGSVGSTQVSNVSAATGNQQPLVPSDGGTDVRAAGAKRVQSGVLVGGSGCAGYNFGFRPDADGAWSPPVAYGVIATAPLVGIRDTSGSSSLSNAAAFASGQVAASTLVSAPIFSSAFASARTKEVEVMPVSGFASGLVRATLLTSSITCVSGTPTAAAYQLQVVHPGGTTSINWTSTSGTTPALPDPASISFTVDGVPRTLADYLSWSVAGAVSEGDNGVSTFGPVLTVSLNSAVLGTSTNTTMELGVLSCVADDRR